MKSVILKSLISLCIITKCFKEIHAGEMFLQYPKYFSFYKTKISSSFSCRNLLSLCSVLEKNLRIQKYQAFYKTILGSKVILKLLFKKNFRISISILENDIFIRIIRENNILHVSTYCNILSYAFLYYCTHLKLHIVL